MKISNILALLFISFFISSCATVGNPKIQNSDAVSQIKKGITTSSQVHDMFGEPQERNTSDAKLETWKYAYINAQVTPVTYVPVIGLFAGGAKSDITSLEIAFDKYNIVKSITTGKGYAESHNFGNTDTHIDKHEK